jgi:hypothetical protein
MFCAKNTEIACLLASVGLRGNTLNSLLQKYFPEFKRWRPTSTDCVYLMKQHFMYEGVSKSFRIGHLERELQIVQLSATRCSCIAILWVSLVSFAVITFVLLLNEFLLMSVCISLSTQSGNFWLHPPMLQSQQTQLSFVRERTSSRCYWTWARFIEGPSVVRFDGQQNYWSILFLRNLRWLVTLFWLWWRTLLCVTFLWKPFAN